MERGDTGLGRDGFGMPRKRRPGNHRAHRHEDGIGPDGPDRPEDAADDDYGHLLRPPGDPPPGPRFGEPGYSRGHQPGRFPPPGTPAGGYPQNGAPVSGGPVNGGPASSGPRRERRPGR